LVGMKRVPMTTQGAYGRSVIVEDLFEIGERRTIFQHRELAVRIAYVVSGAKFNRLYIQRGKLLENRGQRQLRQQRGKHSDTHSIIVSSPRIPGRHAPGQEQATANGYTRHDRPLWVMFQR